MSSCEYKEEHNKEKNFLKKSKKIEIESLDSHLREGLRTRRSPRMFASVVSGKCKILSETEVFEEKMKIQKEIVKKQVKESRRKMMGKTEPPSSFRNSKVKRPKRGQKKKIVRLAHLIQIIVPTQFVDDNNFIQQQTIIEGSMLELSCSAYGRPMPSITWFYRTSSGKRVLCKLTITYVNKIRSLH